ncbi:hypothetical protein [Streptomyces anulatus]|uniref:hypothetical protein n=1 Tax=Streptomyces anulatus TaxID=1892 RepID=UPI001C27F230|nr:hypothetical protein [Streptomyces anulatus]
MTARHALTAAAAAAALLTLSACGSSDDGKPSGQDTAQQETKQVKATAQSYVTAWMSRPSQPEKMCDLETKAARPNYSKDGGSLKGCVTTYTGYFADQKPDDTALTVSIDHVQDIDASGAHPAGKGALATGERAGGEPFRYALRLVKEAGAWRIAQSEEADGEKYTHTADPVADLLANGS